MNKYVIIGLVAAAFVGIIGMSEVSTQNQAAALLNSGAGASVPSAANNALQGGVSAPNAVSVPNANVPVNVNALNDSVQVGGVNAANGTDALDGSRSNSGQGTSNTSGNSAGNQPGTTPSGSSNTVNVYNNTGTSSNVPANGQAVQNQSDLGLYTDALLNRERSLRTSGGSDTSGTASDGTNSQDGTSNGSVVVTERVDGTIEGVQYVDDGLVLTYNGPARFLGLFPARVSADVHVSNIGEVAVDYPWYSFLFKTPKAKVQSRIQTKVDVVKESLAADTSTSARVALTPQTKGIILDEVRKIVHTMNSDATVETTTSAGAR